jgi:23S rRNA (cytosine1962-C5)-methyltransferase
VRASVQTKDRVTRLKLLVTAAAQKSIHSGHPWVFAKSILEQNRQGKAGEIAVIYDKKNKFLAAALYDPESPIRARILQARHPKPIDEAWWAAQLESAIAKRAGLFDEETTGYRMINGESDGWPGLVLDRYEDTLVLKLYTAAWLPHLSEMAGLIAKRLLMGVQAQKRLVLRLSRNIQTLALDRLGKQDGEIVFGPALKDSVIFRETGLRFEADVLRGQKTGFFLDQRENRRKVGVLASGRSLLNVFSFSGGFSLYAARGGATSVADLDISNHALESGRRNFRLNSNIPAVRGCRRDEIKADAFKWLERKPEERFGMIVLDPPSLAKREAERAGAVRAYARLAEQAIAHLAPGGILVACSCSAHVTVNEFFDAVSRSVRRTGRKFKEIERTGHAPDHPASFKEAEYLKAIYLQLYPP